MTIKQNLLFANPKATNKDLEKVLKKAEAHFVFDLEKGINTII
jgi:ABC-type multidrug transport system fused ATPase/permease subunit